MGRIGCLLLIIVLLVVGWDQWRIEQMRGEVNAISSKFHVEKKAAGVKAPSDLVTAMAETERHARRAKEFLAKKKTAQAQEELDKALKSLNSANTVSRDIVGDAAQFLGKARDRAIKTFQGTWKEISQETKPKKQDAEK